MMQKCENCKEKGKILTKNSRKSEFRKKCLAKYGCHGNVKLLGPRHAIPNSFQRNFRKSRSVWWRLLQCLKKSLIFLLSACFRMSVFLVGGNYLVYFSKFKVSAGTFCPFPPPPPPPPRPNRVKPK